MTVNLSSLGGAAAQFFDNNGTPLAGGLIYTYLAGSSTEEATYTTASGLTAQPWAPASKHSKTKLPL